MRSIITCGLIIGLLLVSIIPGCSEKSDPTTPNPSLRGAEFFWDCAEVFPFVVGNPYRDLDIATLVESYDSPYCGEPAVLDYNGNNTSFSIMVSLLDTNTVLGTIPMYAWLDDNGQVVEWEEFGAPSEGFLEYKFPKVDAIYHVGDTQDSSIVMVAVSFMWRLPNAPPPLDNWELGVWLMRWSGFAWHDLPPDIGPPDVTYPLILTAERNQWGHDIAFNPQTRDLFLVFTSDSGGGNYPWRLYYYRIYQPGPPFVWTAVGPWWAVHPGQDMNCWLPSVDVGRLSNMPGYDFPAMFVGVAFTAKNYGGDQYYRVAGNYWDPIDDGDGDQTANVFSVKNTDLPLNLNAGLPCLDIAPNNSTPNYYAIAYVQEVNEDHQYEVYEIDNINNDWFLVSEAPLHANRLKTLPSIACHYTGPADDNAVSVSMYENNSNGTPGALFSPVAVQIHIPSQTIDSQWSKVTVGYDGVNGPWLPFNVAFLDAGIATDIVLTENNWYYIGFADALVSVSATKVYAAWGNTTE